MNILVIGLNHKAAPIEVREKLFFTEDSLKKPLEGLMEIDGLKAGLILSTCNRTEIYAHVEKDKDIIPEIKKFLSLSKNYPILEFEPYLYSYISGEAVNHIFRVASSLDSLVIGEPQILGQFKKSLQIASESKVMDFLLMQIMTKALEAAKLVRTETEIAKSAVSISSCAVELAVKIFGQLQDKSAMILGAGEMAELALEHLISDGVKKIYVVNRSFDKAQNIAAKYSGEAIQFDDYRNYLGEVDIVITSTGAPHYLIKTNDIKSIMRARKFKPIFLIDISVPRNVEPAINDIDNAYVYDVDDLNLVVETNKTRRQKEVLKAEKIIEKEVSNLFQWYNSLAVVPIIKSLREKFDNIRQSEIEKVLRKSDNHFGEQEKKLIEDFSVAFMNKILHEPLTRLKEFSDSDEGFDQVEIAKKLFNIENK